MSAEDDEIPQLISSEGEVQVETESAFKRIVVNNLTDFFKDSIKFLKGCRTPGDQPFAIVLGLTGTGAVVMGLISFVVKVVHIPLTQVLVLKSD